MKFIKLKQFRQKRGLTQMALVAQTGISQSMVSFLENGGKEVRESHLEALKVAFPEEDFSSYIYESDRYPAYLNYLKQCEEEEEKDPFSGMWTVPTPIETVDTLPIICKNGRVRVAIDGHIILDRNDGSFNTIGNYVIEPAKFSDNHLIAKLTRKSWFDSNLYEEFKRAYLIGCRLAGMHPVEQERIENNSL